MGVLSSVTGSSFGPVSTTTPFTIESVTVASLWCVCQCLAIAVLVARVPPPYNLGCV